MNALTSGLASDFSLGYMNSGRESGAYSPDWIASVDGATHLSALSPTLTRPSLSWFCS
jgi:hypothetical protein